jgi:hypothetical protein
MNTATVKEYGYHLEMAKTKPEGTREYLPRTLKGKLKTNYSMWICD